MSQPQPRSPFVVGDWTVRPSRLRLEREDAVVEVEPKVMEVLVHLVARPGHVHTRRELLDALWPEVVVGDEALTRAIYELRKAVGDDSRSPRYIETIPKIGYRLIAGVEPLGEDDGAGESPGSTGFDSGEKKFRTLLDESFDISTVINRDGTIRHAVPAFERVLGYPVGDVEGRSIFELVVPEDRDRIREAFARSLREDGLSPTIEARFLHADGTIRTLRGHGHAFFEDPDIDGLLLMTRLVSSDPPSGGDRAASTPPPTFRMRGRAVAVVATLLVLSLTVVGVWREIGSGEDATRPADGPTESGPVPVTTEPGIERSPAISPDGRRIAYTRETGDEGAHLVVRDMEGGEPIRLTDGEGVDHAPVWSPDGGRIAFMSVEGGRCRVVTIPSLGGPEVEVGTCEGARQNAVYQHLSWSPDGRWLAFADGPPIPIHGASIRIVDLESGNLDGLRFPDATDPSPALLPTFSPSGDRLAFVRFRDDLYDLVVAEFGNGGLSNPPRVVVPGVNHVDGVAWSRDGRTLVFSSDRGGSYTLFRIDLEGGEATPLGVGLEAHRPATAPDRDAVVFESWTTNQDVWLYPGPAAIGAHEPRRILDSTRVDFQPTVTGEGDLAFFSNRGGRTEVWSADSDGGNPVAVTSLGADGMLLPSWSPDERRLLFAAQVPEAEGRDWGLYVLDDFGDPPRRLADRPGYQFAGTWGADGRWIYFGSGQGEDWEIWRVPVGGGPAEIVTDRGGYAPRIDGDRLYYTKFGRDGLWARPLAGGPEERITSEFPSWDLFWIIRDGAIWRIASESDRHLARFDLQTRTWERVLDLPADVVSGFDLSRGLERLYLARDAGSTSDLRAVAF